jgi:hypothetical protein
MWCKVVWGIISSKPNQNSKADLHQNRGESGSQLVLRSLLHSLGLVIHGRTVLFKVLSSVWKIYSAHISTHHHSVINGALADKRDIDNLAEIPNVGMDLTLRAFGLPNARLKGIFSIINYVWLNCSNCCAYLIIGSFRFLNRTWYSNRYC